MALISIAMCTYNGEKYIQKQLESIAGQSLLPNELVVCDDGSTDATVEILQKFAATAAFSVRLIQNVNNLGSTRNFEKAIGLCHGDLIALSDQDDVWCREKLVRLSTVLLTDPMIGGVFSDAELVDEKTCPIGETLWHAVHFSPKKSDKRLKGDLTKILLKQDVVTGATLMFRSSLRNICLPIDPSWVHDGWIAWMLASYSRLVPVDELLIKYRIHKSQQIGLLPISLGGRLNYAKQTRRGDYLLLARRFEALRSRWIGAPGENQKDRLRGFDGRIGLLYLRAELPRRRIQRLYYVLRASRAYREYAEGWKSIAKDLLLPRI
jgi:glycosyltransferase involved in cell wall biosynthesis